MVLYLIRWVLTSGKADLRVEWLGRGSMVAGWTDG